MFYAKRLMLYSNYAAALDHFKAAPQQLIDLEHFITGLVTNEIQTNYTEIKRDYDEASYLNAFWANYPPEDRGRAPVGDQVPWIEVGEHAVGHKLCRMIGSKYTVSEIGLPSGADNRFVLYHDEILRITGGFTDCAFVFLDIKSVGPRDNYAHTVLSPYQVSGDGIWKAPDKNMENYRKIVIADDSEMERRYTSDYRGRVQNKNVVVKLEPMFALTYYEKDSEVKRAVHFYKYIEELNHSKLCPRPLKITNMEAPLTEEQVRFHFALIDSHTSDIVNNAQDAKVRFLRGLDFYLVQDFDSSIEDFTQSILLDDKFFPSYFMRALVRYKQLEYRKAEAASDADLADSKVHEVTALDYEIVRKDLDRVVELAPDFVYGYYNRGNVLSMLKDYRAALVDYDKAISLNADFAEAYYNRGLTHIFLGNNKQGIADLSKAGELGIVSAYNVIKRFMVRTE